MDLDELKYISFINGYNQALRDEASNFLKTFCEKHNFKNILEIGTSIGYSACLMADILKEAKITTIEKDEITFNKAKESFLKYNFSQRITQLLGDAFDYLKILPPASFDLIFLDGPKAQYIKYLPYLKILLKKGGYLIADNIFFHGLVKLEDNLVKHKHRTIVVNLRKFLYEIQNDTSLLSEVLDIGDGLSISKKLED